MKKILVIEDDRIMRENMAELLELSHYEVNTAENGKLGIAAMKSWKPDLVVCDVMMPELDGYGVLYIIQKDKELARTPFIFLTAKADKNDFRKGMNLGADDFLTKPFQDIELLDAIERRLQKYELYGSSTSHAPTPFTVDDITDKYSCLAYQASEFLFRPEEDAHYLYYLKEGSIKSYRMNADGKEFITEVYESGDFFGYQAILESRPYEEFAETLMECTIYKIPKQDFLTELKQNMGLASQFIKLISKGLTAKEEELMHLAYSSVRKRVIRKLLELCGENELEAPISRADFAINIGTSTETLVRTLSELKDDQIIEVDGTQITILDKQKLIEVEQVC